MSEQEKRTYRIPRSVLVPTGEGWEQPIPTNEKSMNENLTMLEQLSITHLSLKKNQRQKRSCRRRRTALHWAAPEKCTFLMGNHGVEREVSDKTTKIRKNETASSLPVLADHSTSSASPTRRGEPVQSLSRATPEQKRLTQLRRSNLMSADQP